MHPLILVLNAGSSSLKFAVHEDAADLPRVLKGSVSGLSDAPRLKIVFTDGRPSIDDRAGESSMDGSQALSRVFAELRGASLMERVAAVGHRIVHGGKAFTGPTRLDASTLDALRRLVPLAPLHQQLNLALVTAACEALPDALQIACFDTAFHVSQPRLARLYGVPRALTDDGVLAYGFHGLSYAYVASALAERYGPRAGGRVIVAHLGSGVSLCALLDGRSVATTMGFSALDGPPMSTRCGSLDPGVLLFLMQERGLSVETVSDLLYERSGWLGVSGISGDMAILLESEDARAREAVDLFVYRVGREIGSLAAALGGLDRLVFTAGIGENAPVIRARICESASWLGLRVDSSRNARGDGIISADDSAIESLVIPTDEELAIARELRTWRAIPRS